MESNDQLLRLFRRESPVKVLGPYSRAVVWVQGCHFACANCIVPESWSLDGGEQISVEELTAWVLAQHDIEGITISGGEPMLQTNALCSLIDSIRCVRDLGVVCYTGYTHEFLSTKGSPPQKELLSRIDLLIDGVYLEGRHGNLLWRGSDNQRLLPLSNRYDSYLNEQIVSIGDRSVGIEVVMDEDGGIGYAGVPASPGFRDDFINGMKARGIRLGYQISTERAKEGAKQ